MAYRKMIRTVHYPKPMKIIDIINTVHVIIFNSKSKTIGETHTVSTTLLDYPSQCIVFTN